MHRSVHTFVKRMVRKYGLQTKSVLEIGACNVNGSVRDLFAGDYIGLDIVDGPGVDIVTKNIVGQFDSKRFEVVVTTEQLEHDPNPWLTMQAVKKVLKPGGYLVATARGNGFPHHNPPDYWRFMPESVEVLFDLAGCDVLVLQNDPAVSGVFAVGKRRAD